uniref:Serine protease n=1 Tax=Knipowitschia caucasica TaxID=637954 RepID=A0AAV2K1W9_KNICA
MFEALQFESEAVSQNRSGDGAWSSSLLKVPVLIPKTRAVRVTTLLQTQDPDTVFSSLRRHNPELRKWTSRQFPGSAFEYALKNANFEKLHQEFSEVFRLKKLITLGDSVCALYVGDICQGSGFMLAGDFIMTNAHLLENALLEDGKTLAVSVKALFNHENNLIESEVLLMYEAYSGVIDLDKEMDYAVLRLKRGAKPMPPGLLPYFGPKPNAGGACIIGHPGDQVKKIDLTYIIGKKEREAAANQHLEPYDESARMIIVKEAVESGINEIWSSEEVITYNTVCMFHGSSGSPLMDANGRVVGIHSAGFVYEYEGLKHSVIEYAHPTLQIFARFLSNVGPLDIESARDVGQLSSTNPYLRDVILEYLIL